MSFLDSVESLFGIRDLYDVLGVPKDSEVSDIKRAYRKLSLKVHPDRVKPEEVENATKKFQVLCKIYLVLSDDNKRAFYDDTGLVDDDADAIEERNWNDYWRLMFKKITIDDIVDFEKKYKKSEEEKDDLKSAYLKYEGNMDHIMESVLCADIDDEPRFMGTIAGWIAEGSVPPYHAFTHKTERKKRKRQKTYEKDREEFKKDHKDEQGSSSSLSALIKARQATRQQEFDGFFDRLEEKYGPKKFKGATDSSKKGGKKKTKKK